MNVASAPFRSPPCPMPSRSTAVTSAIASTPPRSMPTVASRSVPTVAAGPVAPALIPGTVTGAGRFHVIGGQHHSNQCDQCHDLHGRLEPRRRHRRRRDESFLGAAPVAPEADNIMMGGISPTTAAALTGTPEHLDRHPQYQSRYHHRQWRRRSHQRGLGRQHRHLRWRDHRPPVSSSKWAMAPGHERCS